MRYNAKARDLPLVSDIEIFVVIIRCELEIVVFSEHDTDCVLDSNVAEVLVLAIDTYPPTRTALDPLLTSFTNMPDVLLSICLMK